MAVRLPVAESENEPFAGETQPSRDDTGDGIQQPIGRCLEYAEEGSCEIFATLCIYLNRAILPDRFSVAMSPNHNKWGS
jgi:hypothetical protein